MLKDGEINHYVKIASAPKPGEKVHGTIDWQRRHKNMKVHTAGHVIDFALYLLGYSPNPLYPNKGDHGKKPFVNFMGTVNKEIKQELQDKVNELIQKNIRFSWSFESLEDLEKEALYLQPGLPKNKPLRALRLEGVATVADGGTILGSTSEVGHITILAIEQDGTETYVRYQVE
jgi:Ser-tRNA(Ala) deacylase AlaX